MGLLNNIKGRLGFDDGDWEDEYEEAEYDDFSDLRDPDDPVKSRSEHISSARARAGRDTYEDLYDSNKASSDVVVTNRRPRNNSYDRYDASGSGEEVRDWIPPTRTSRAGSDASIRLTSRSAYTGFNDEDEGDSSRSRVDPSAPRKARGTISSRTISGLPKPPERASERTIDRPSRSSTPSPSAGSQQLNMHIVEARSFTDAEDLGEHFKRGQAVILNITSARADTAKRLLDFASGLTFALDGSIQRVSDKVFMLTPRNVVVSDAEKRRLREIGLIGDGEA